jgi:predicted HAD superfamily Cof-like phosphohydrolase
MSSTHATDPTEPDEIRRDIEQTREQLSETVDALAARLDVKSRANEKVREVRETAAQRAQEARAQAVSSVHQARAQAVGSVNDARTWAQHTWDERPQAVVAGASAIIAAIVVALVARRRR